MANKALVNHLAWNDFLAQFSASSCDYLEKFSSLSDNEARIKFCLQEKTLTDKIQSWVSWTKHNRYEKDYKKALDAKLEGNKYFASKNYEASCQRYTQCIMWAPNFNEHENTENILAIGYANRSAAEFHLEKYQDCLHDIQMAMDSGFSRENHYKLFARRGQCLLKLGQNTLGIDALQKGLSSLQLNDTLPSNRIECLNREMKGLIHNAGVECVITPDHNLVCDELCLSYGENCTIASASAALKMNYTKEKGRHIVATQDLNAGDTVFVEKPFSSVLLPDYYISHCHSCHCKLTFSIPCENCSQILYCSLECRNQSWKDSHLLECGHLDLLHAIGIAHLAYRTVLVARIQFLLENMSRLQEMASSHLQSEEWHGDYFSVHSLVTHEEKMKNEDLFCYAATACLLMSLLKTTAMQKITLKCQDGTLSEISSLTSQEEIFLGSLFLRHIQQLICNAHAITEVKFGKRTCNSQVEKIEQVRIATAIYPSASLMNHACEPDIISSFRKNVLIVRIIKNVPAGREVCNCYGPHFARMTREERLSSLKEQYFFTCMCQRCLNGIEEEESINSLRCHYCGANIAQPKCPKTLKVTCKFGCKAEDYQRILKDLAEASTLQPEADQLIDLSELTGANIKLCQCLKLREAHLNDHHPELTRTRDMLAECCAMQGNYERALQFLKVNADSVQRCFGVNSIEVAHECQKLIDVIVRILRENNNCAPYIRWCYAREMLEAVEKALKIFLLHYGKETFSVDELQAQRMFAKAALQELQHLNFE